MTTPIRLFIGYDSKIAGIFSVMAHSIHRRASVPVSITPLMLSQLGGVYRREHNPLQSTEFSFSRFLVPYLCDYQGWALFTDNDMIVRDDIANLWALRDDRYAVMCVKHNHRPTEETKFLGAAQTKYEKKNWSSVMLFNCAKCTALTTDYVNTATGLELHQFKWLDSEDLIGSLPPVWNHLAGYDAPDAEAKLVHYTIGGPYFHEYQDVEYAAEWYQERDAMIHVSQRKPV